MNTATTLQHALAPAPAKARPIWARVIARRQSALILSLIGLLVIVVLALQYGSTRASLRDLFDSSSPLHYVLLNLRLPRVVCGVMVGAALALSGALLQGLLRNPLADPGVLGVTSFAGLGAAMAYLFLPVGLLFVPGAAFIFALIAAGAIALFASRKSTGGSEHLVLCGIALGTTATALLSVCMLLSRDDVMPLIAWIVGSISGKSWGTLATSGTLCLTGIGAALSLGGKLNVIQLGESTARSLGLNYRLLRVVIIVVASLLVAVSASLAGLVGFVGLIVPHLARMICGDDYRFLLPLSAILGGALVVGGDLVARSVLAPTELPVGAVTALCGGPFFFYLILRPKQSKLCPALH